jgi:hypothetical protein
VRNGPWSASRDTGWRFLPIARLTGSTAIPDLLAFFVLDLGYQFLTKGIILILTYFKNVCRADFYTLTATVTLIGIENDEPVTGTVFKTIESIHLIYSFMMLPNKPFLKTSLGIL